MVKKNKRTLVLVLSLIFILSGCMGTEKHYYVSLLGESQKWKLTGYEIVITPDRFAAGNGTLQIKNENNYTAHYFSFETHVVMYDQDRVVHTGSVSGPGFNIAEQNTGAIDGGTYFDKKGTPVTLSDVSAIYMIVEWREHADGEIIKERIDLFDKTSKEHSFID